MEVVRLLGIRKIKSMSYTFAVFKCPVCGGECEKILRHGLKQDRCSHSCYAITRSRRGAYNESVMISGYRHIYVPDHPNCSKKGYVAEHRLVAEKKIGRFLTSDDIAHHKNENKLDNSPDNIEVMTKSQHSKHHQNFKKCKIKFES